MATKGWFLPCFLIGSFLVTMGGLYAYLFYSDVEIANRYSIAMGSEHAKRQADTDAAGESNGEADRRSSKVLTNQDNGLSDSRVIRSSDSESTPDAIGTKSISDLNKRSPKLKAALAAKWRKIETSLALKSARIANDLDRAALRWRSNIGRDPILRTTVAWTCYHSGDVRLAERHIDAVLDMLPGNAFALDSKIAMGNQTANWDRVTDAYRELAARRPDDPTPRYNLGVTYSRMGDLALASHWFRSALEVDPIHVRSLYNMASISQHHGRLADADEFWRRLTSVQPNVISAWFNYGINAMDLGRNAEAALAFEQVIRIDPDEADGYINLGRAQLAIGNLEAARATLDRAIELEPCSRFAAAALIETCELMADWFPTRRWAMSMEIDRYRELLPPNHPLQLSPEDRVGDAEAEDEPARYFDVFVDADAGESESDGVFDLVR